MNKNELKIVFMGNPDFAVESLRKIHESGYNIAGVVTMPDRVGGRGNKRIESAVKQYAMAAGLPNIMQPEKLRDPEFIDRLRSIDADLFIVIAFRMLPEVVWTMPRLGTFNLHASLLPKYRGAAPLNWAVINGDKETGVTTFFLRHEIDTGDIIDRESIEIGPDENVGSVHDRLMHIGARLTVKTIDSIIDGSLTTIPQQSLLGDNTRPTPAPKIFKETCKIDWTADAEKIHNLVRGLSPYPGAWSTLHAEDGNEADIKIYTTLRTDRSAPANSVSGTVIIDCGHMYVVCGCNSLIEITELQAPGKKRMHADEYLRGIRWNNAKFI